MREIFCRNVLYRFGKIWKKVENTDNLGPYLYVALRNRVFNFLQQRSKSLVHLLEESFSPVQSVEEIYSVLRTKEIKTCIAEALDRMPEKMRDVYILSREQNLTIAEIAAMLDRSPQTVKNQLGEATARIRQHLKNNHLKVWLFFI